MRDPTDHERQIFAELLSIPFLGRDDIERMLRTARVSQLDDAGSLAILCGERRPTATVKQVPVEGEMLDKDGVAVHVLLHVRDGKPSELEIYKDDGSPIGLPIDPKQLSVVALPPHPAVRSS